MINYTSQFQTKIAEFSSINHLNLNPNNRWIILAGFLPWDELVSIYKKRFSTTMGAGSIDPRYIIGAFIIKHKLGLTDDETLLTISENPYMQFFMGLDHYQPDQLFSPTLFVEMRKKLGDQTFDEFSTTIMSIAHPAIDQKKKKEALDISKPKGKLKIDATVADQYITYPNDLGLVNQARIKTENMIDDLFELLRNEIKVKPRTYRKIAHKRYLQEAKKKKKSAASIRKAIRVLLNCVKRNLDYIDQMLNQIEGSFPFTHKRQLELMVIHTLYQQQQGMYDKRIHQCDDRIVSISQPHVRPIVRGKQGKSVEFGAKLGLSVMDGFMTKDTLSWQAYNESEDLVKQAEAYKVLFGHYPELIQADKIYATNFNRKWCKENGVRLTASPKGKLVPLSAYQKAKLKKEYAQRNAVEGRIGNAKQVYSLNQIKAKLKTTSQTWIAATLFVLNLSRAATLMGWTF
ncbi:MAG: IS5 family transposase [Cyclobacteriaceae bacterium]|nr:IS5 family transposase [Cyclobacteriaceae bacterium]